MSRTEKKARRDAPGSTRGVPGSVIGMLVKIVALGTIIGLAVMLTPALVGTQQWGFLAVIWAVVAVLAVTYATRRFVPAKYLVPGTLLLVLFVVYPILMTFQLSTTNFGDGTRTTKEVTVSRIIGNAAQQVPNAKTFGLSVGSEGTATSGPYTFLLVDTATNKPFAGTPDGLRELDPDTVTVENGLITAAEGFTLLDRRQINEFSQRGGDLEGFAVPTENGVITAQGFKAVELFSPLEYDEATDTVTNVETGVTYTPVQSGDRKFFTSAEGDRLSDQSWGENVGLGNYEAGYSGPARGKL
ncbi:hypothetical protein [Pseudarthrobacter oxydans]|uniref:hypothetical protein n=1 Tax=Pseudarthrobacter oxydans TaxID=1671 RepID=UPI0034146BC1